VKIDVHWTAFPLHPETPQDGRSLEDLFAGRPINIPEMLAHLRKTADQLGLPFGDRQMTFNSRRAQELGKWAEACGTGDAFHRAVFKAYFADGRNLARIPVLMDIAQSVDLDPDEARTVLETQRYQAAVDRDWQRSRSMGITAVPTFVMNNQHLVGAQAYHDLARFVRTNISN
jgi:predicted DsbA family dithiol-disulfide isomerase